MVTDRLEIDSPGGEGIVVRETRDTGVLHKETTLRISPQYHRKHFATQP